jgi:hypothetical protein
MPLRDLGAEFPPYFQGRDSQVEVDIRVLVTRQEKPDRIVGVMLQYEIGKGHFHCKNTQLSLHLHD